MARRRESDTVEFTLGSHRRGGAWQEARIVYDYANPKHRQQVDAALRALLDARYAVAPDADDEPGEEAP
jgi:hypothetical protein